MTLLRGYAENLPLQRWLEEKCFPFEAKMTAEDCYWGTVLACAEMARFGVVSFSDMYYATEERARAVLEAGMKANMCEGLVAFEEKPYAEYPICAQMEALVRDWHGAGDGRIRIDYNIHSEYLSTETVCRDILDIVLRHRLASAHPSVRNREGSARVPRAPRWPHAGGLFRQLGVVRGARDGGSLRVGG